MFTILCIIVDISELCLDTDVLPVCLSNFIKLNLTAFISKLSSVNWLPRATRVWVVLESKLNNFWLIKDILLTTLITKYLTRFHIICEDWKYFVYHLYLSVVAFKNPTATSITLIDTTTIQWGIAKKNPDSWEKVQFRPFLIHISAICLSPTR